MTSFVLEYAGNVAMHASNNNDNDKNNITNNNNHNNNNDNNNNSPDQPDSDKDRDKDSDEGHPLLDFVVAADVFMYLGNITVGYFNRILPH